MELNELINKSFTEDEIFELLVFEVEENFQQYLGKHFHLNFELSNNNRLKITEIVSLENEDDLHLLNRKKFEKIIWIYVSDNCGHIDIVLIRTDRSNRIGIVYKNKDTYTQNCGFYSYIDEWPDSGPLTEEELREGFAELAGCLEQYRKSKNKIAV